MNLKKFTSKQNGIGLLELMLSLAIIAILLVMATRYWVVSNSSNQVNRAVAQLGAIQGAIANYRSGNPAVTQITYAELDKIGALSRLDYNPKGGAGGTVTNPWGGTIDLGWDNSKKGVTITFNQIPQTACENLANKYTNDPNVTASCNDPNNGNTFVYLVK